MISRENGLVDEIYLDKAGLDLKVKISNISRVSNCSDTYNPAYMHITKSS